MNSDSEESSFEDDSPPNFAFSPGFNVRASPVINGVGVRAKRKVSLPSRYQILSARGGCLDNTGGIYSEHPRKKRKGDQINTPDSASDRSFACPYYKNDPVKHSSCAEWNKKDIHRVKEHIKRSHLKPIQCPRCPYRAGDNGQINIHLRDGDCQRTKTSPVESDVLKKAKALERRNLNWQHIYQILFGCDESDIPSPIWQSNITPPTPPTIKLESSPLLGAYCSDMFEAHLNEELNEFIEYFQEQVPRLVREIFREFQALKFKSEYPLPCGGVDSAYNQSSAPHPSASKHHHNNNININNTDYDQAPRKPKTTAKNSPKEQKRSDEIVRKPTEAVVRKKQSALAAASPPRQRPNSRMVASDEKQAQLGDLLSKDEAVQKRHSPIALITPSTHHQQQQQPNVTNPATPQEQVFANNRNEAQKMHDIPSPYIQLQHTRDTLGQNFAPFQHDGTNRGIIPDHAARILHEPRVTDNTSSPVVGFGDLALGSNRDDTNGEVEEEGCDPTMLWMPDLTDHYDWRF